MATEHFSARYQDLDAWPSLDILSAFLEGQLAAVAAVRSALPAIAEAAEAAAERLRRGGRLVYVGAGTSGRIGVQDGAELPPTFNWPEARLVYLMAGGPGALLSAVENAEDSVEQGTENIRNADVGPNDVVIGVAASGNTPYTVAALKEAKARGAQTIGVSNNSEARILAVASHPIVADTGEEVLAGSTRMKAGTAQKVILNLFSTLLMIRMGRVYRGLMVDMRATNAKLRRRSVAMVIQITGCDEATAANALSQSDGVVKIAALVALGLSRAEADALLARSEGNLRVALSNLSK
ncbi:N-acetylmuramic acid 6-phosphate etherase [Microvirga pudoricolor]|uniref:N-acetylmuramic acid 6-phosphate etherase n=1 Tax=Microvirga pudoricolor TaxID=2778729 RepID=UPI001E49B128|nr:N-acetylmuramic acid 6-phosphate etherase [Microvirga pudoricolor]